MIKNDPYQYPTFFVYIFAKIETKWKPVVIGEVKLKDIPCLFYRGAIPKLENVIIDLVSDLVIVNFVLLGEVNPKISYALWISQ